MGNGDWVVGPPDPDAYGGGTNLRDDGGFLTGVVAMEGPGSYGIGATSMVDLDPFEWSVIFGVTPIGFIVQTADLAKMRRTFHYRRFLGDATRGAGHPALGTMMAIEDAGAAGQFREVPAGTDLSDVVIYAYVVGLARRKFTLSAGGLVLPED